MRLLRVVFDTNMYIMAVPGALTGGSHGDYWLKAARPVPGQAFQLYTSDAILDELEAVLTRKGFSLTSDLDRPLRHRLIRSAARRT